MKHNLTLQSLLKPLPVRNVDGTLNHQGAICHTTIQTLQIKNHATNFHQECAKLYITSLADQDIILGTDWLCAHNPKVNWSQSQIVFSHCPVSCHLSKYPVSVEPMLPIWKNTTINQLFLDPIPDFYDDLNFLNTGLDIFLSLYHLIKEDLLQISAKTTTSTKLIAHLAPPAPLIQVPAQYHMYAKVFSEQAPHHLPQHQPWDHAIDLIPGVTFGLCNAPATFQTFINDIFKDLLNHGHVVIYLDDILIFHDSLATLHDLTHTVLQHLGKFDLYLKPEKCSFDKTSIEYLGIIITDGQVCMDPAKVVGITWWKISFYQWQNLDILYLITEGIFLHNEKC